MQETRNNCFGSKICSTTLRQMKTGKHECRNICNSNVQNQMQWQDFNLLKVLIKYQAKTGKHEYRHITATYKIKYNGKILIY